MRIPQETLLHLYIVFVLLVFPMKPSNVLTDSLQVHRQTSAADFKKSILKNPNAASTNATHYVAERVVNSPLTRPFITEIITAFKL